MACDVVGSSDTLAVEGPYAYGEPCCTCWWYSDFGKYVVEAVVAAVAAE